MMPTHHACLTCCQASCSGLLLALIWHASVCWSCRAHALLAYLEVEVPRLLSKAHVSLFARMRGVVKLPQGSKDQASEQVGSLPLPACCHAQWCFVSYRLGADLLVPAFQAWLCRCASPCLGCNEGMSAASPLHTTRWTLNVLGSILLSGPPVLFHFHYDVKSICHVRLLWMPDCQM